MPDQKFSLRPFLPSDSSAIENLIVEVDDSLTTRFLVDAYSVITGGSEYRTVGVVAESAGFDGIVGIGTVRFWDAQYNGQVLPLAFLDNLKVRKEFRNQGLGYQIAAWRVQKAREEFGDEGIIATGMLQDNLASRGVASKWSREFIGPMNVFIVPTRSKPPGPVAGITVRKIQPADFEAFADKQNAFYADYNLYKPNDPDSLRALLELSTGGKKPYQLFVAADSAGNLLAGAQVWLRGLLKSDTINQIPPPLRILNGIVKFLPPDLVIRDAAVTGLWYAPGQIGIARQLWETIRWETREQATSVAAGFDPRDPAQAVLTLKPWYQPRPKIAIAIHGPTPIDRAKLVYNHGRV